MSKLANSSIQIGAVNIEDDLEMDDFLESEMKRIDLKRKRLQKLEKMQNDIVYESDEDYGAVEYHGEIQSVIDVIQKKNVTEEEIQAAANHVEITVD